MQMPVFDFAFWCTSGMDAAAAAHSTQAVDEKPQSSGNKRRKSRIQHEASDTVCESVRMKAEFDALVEELNAIPQRQLVPMVMVEEEEQDEKSFFSWMPKRLEPQRFSGWSNFPRTHTLVPGHLYLCNAYFLMPQERRTPKVEDYHVVCFLQMLPLPTRVTASEEGQRERFAYIRDVTAGMLAKQKKEEIFVVNVKELCEMPCAGCLASTPAER